MLKTFLVPPFLAGHAPDLWSLEPETLTRGIFSCRAFSYIALMNMMIRDGRSELSRRLLDRLRPMVAGKLDVGMHPYGEQLFAYCCFDRERLAALRLDCPMICIVLHGQKDVWLGDRTRSFPAGSLFVLPGGVAMDVVNIPDDKTGVYAALRLDVPSLPAGIPPLSVAERAGRAADLDAVPLSIDLVETICHAASTIADVSVGETIKRLRLTEVLALLRPLAEARPLFRQSLSDDIAWLIATAPSEPWNVSDVAEKLGIGASTLRRRLATDGTSFRAILRRERLRAAQHAITSGATAIAAAEAAGYVSRSHFSRRFRESFGTSPTGRS